MSGHKPHGGGDGHEYWRDSEGCSSGGPLVAYRSSSEESTPLLPGKTRRVISQGGFKCIAFTLLALLAFLFVSANLYMHFANCPLYPWEMLAIRRDWEKVEAQHDVMREEWRLEELEHATIVEEWQLQREWHGRDVAHRIQEENERQERVRQEYALEFERYAREVEEYDKAVARRVHEEQERQERVREEWAQEVEEHWHEREEMERHENQRRENERQKWRREVEDHDRIEEERRKREEEERQKLNMFWGRVEARTCTTYATREYTAQLMNLPTTWEHRVEACKATPLEVHGVSYLPKNCEDKGPGVVIGNWEINQHEPDCTPFWIWYKDQERLYISGIGTAGKIRISKTLHFIDLATAQRIEQFLEHLPKGSDWREFCATTPARFNGMEFSGAQECFPMFWIRSSIFMVRFNTNANYGATSSVPSPPPPAYPGYTPPSGPPQFNDNSPVDSARSPCELLCKRFAWMHTRLFVSLLTFGVTLGLCMITMPVTYCNDPMDPHVRERIREEWSKEYIEHEKQVAEREVVKARWTWEDEQHAALLREWEQERLQHERAMRERAQREEDERKRLNLFWGHGETHQCKTYGTREYSAVLMNLPMNWERRVEACKATPLEIHGTMHMPNRCEDKRIEQYLENLPEGSDWREFCATTPARFLGMEFSGAQECISSTWGVYGQWVIDDSKC
ncbi:hypothetical protein J3R82DRAFT_9235 [Butyriboletus roseoflavus]|nr:hypothetical protein J3R82DRAFT_9235 [Butyriboletus roseoflavus]